MSIWSGFLSGQLPGALFLLLRSDRSPALASGCERLFEKLDGFLDLPRVFAWITGDQPVLMTRDHAVQLEDLPSFRHGRPGRGSGRGGGRRGSRDQCPEQVPEVGVLVEEVRRGDRDRSRRTSEATRTACRSGPTSRTSASACRPRVPDTLERSRRIARRPRPRASPNVAIASKHAGARCHDHRPRGFARYSTMNVSFLLWRRRPPASCKK